MIQAFCTNVKYPVDAIHSGRPRRRPGRRRGSHGIASAHGYAPRSQRFRLSAVSDPRRRPFFTDCFSSGQAPAIRPVVGSPTSSTTCRRCGAVGRSGSTSASPDINGGVKDSRNLGKTKNLPYIVILFRLHSSRWSRDGGLEGYCMPYVIAAPDMLAAAASDVAGIGSSSVRPMRWPRPRRRHWRLLLGMRCRRRSRRCFPATRRSIRRPVRRLRCFIRSLCRR